MPRLVHINPEPIYAAAVRLFDQRARWRNEPTNPLGDYILDIGLARVGFRNLETGRMAFRIQLDDEREYCVFRNLAGDIHWGGRAIAVRELKDMHIVPDEATYAELRLIL